MHNHPLSLSRGPASNASSSSPSVPPFKGGEKMATIIDHHGTLFAAPTDVRVSERERSRRIVWKENTIGRRCCHGAHSGGAGRDRFRLGSTSVPRPLVRPSVRPSQ